MKQLAEYINEAMAEVQNQGEFKQWLTDNGYKFEEVKSGWGNEFSCISVETKTKGVRAIFDFVRKDDKCVEFLYKIEKNGEVLYEENSTRQIDGWHENHTLDEYIEPRRFYKSIVDIRKRKLDKAKRERAKKQRDSKPGWAVSDLDVTNAQARYEQAQKIYNEL